MFSGGNTTLKSMNQNPEDEGNKLGSENMADKQPNEAGMVTHQIAIVCCWRRASASRPDPLGANKRLAMFFSFDFN